MVRIVTYAHHYKRPPRKKQAVPLAGPAVVTRRAGKPKAAPAATAAPLPANDDRKPVEAAKSAIVTTTSRKQLTLERVGREDRPEDPEAAAAMRAWLEQAKWGRGPAG